MCLAFSPGAFSKRPLVERGAPELPHICFGEWLIPEEAAL
jgi:hypothetical protein